MAQNTLLTKLRSAYHFESIFNDSNPGNSKAQIPDSRNNISLPLPGINRLMMPLRHGEYTGCSKY